MNKDRALNVRVQRLREMAKRRQLILQKIKRKDRGAFDYGKFNLLNQHGDPIATLIDVEEVERTLANWSYEGEANG